jgi:hypothetical protein
VTPSSFLARLLKLTFHTLRIQLEISNMNFASLAILFFGVAERRRYAAIPSLEARHPKLGATASGALREERPT